MCTEEFVHLCERHLIFIVLNKPGANLTTSMINSIATKEVDSIVNNRVINA